MDDYRIRTSWRTSRKRKRVMRELGAAGVLAVTDLWGYAANSRRDGDLCGLSNQDIADEVDWDGDANELMRVLVDARLIDGSEGAYVIHDWCEHNPHVAGSEERTEQARKAGLASAAARKKRAEEIAAQKSTQTQQTVELNPTAVENSSTPTYLPTYQPTKEERNTVAPTSTVLVTSTAAGGATTPADFEAWVVNELQGTVLTQSVLKKLREEKALPITSSELENAKAIVVDRTDVAKKDRGAFALGCIVRERKRPPAPPGGRGRAPENKKDAALAAAFAHVDEYNAAVAAGLEVH